MTPAMDAPTIAIIGHGNHAKRLMGALEPIANVTKVYHPYRLVSDPRATLDFEDVRRCDAVVIASPDDTHAEYLFRLGPTYPGYVLCEKPPITTGGELTRLRTGDGPAPSRLMFDFVYRFSGLRDAIDAAGALGAPVSISATVGHGLAFKPGYAGSWRPRGDILVTLGIHVLDLFIATWGRPSRMDVTCFSSSGIARDTACFTCLWEREERHTVGRIVASYAMPHTFELDIVCTDGAVMFRDGIVTARGPRDTFDGRGHFMRPPVIRQWELDIESEYDAALARAVGYFVGAVASRTSIPPKEYEASLATCDVTSALRVGDTTA